MWTVEIHREFKVEFERIMSISFDEIMNQLPDDRRNRIIAESDRLEAEHLTLQMLRKAKKLTQAQLADVLDIRQATVSNMEKRSDLLLSTLRGYVEAMGGKLSLTVEFPDLGVVVLEGLGDTER